MASRGESGVGRARARERGVTLVEMLMAVALIGLLTSMAMVGMNVAKGARLKRSATMIAGAVRLAYAHANAISKPVRLVFDCEQNLVILEEGSSALLLVRGERAGGAEAATEAERLAREETEKVLEGPRAPRSTFKQTKAFGFSPDADKPGKALAQGIRFVQVETDHQDEPELARAYLYFWPGGQTERAAIVITKAGFDDETESEADQLTVLVSPLTGKTEIKRGKIDMPRPRDEREESEREDTGS